MRVRLEFGKQYQALQIQFSLKENISNGVHTQSCPSLPYRATSQSFCVYVLCCCNKVPRPGYVVKKRGSVAPLVQSWHLSSLRAWMVTLGRVGFGRDNLASQGAREQACLCTAVTAHLGAEDRVRNAGSTLAT